MLRVVNLVGRVLFTSGTLILLFVAYQLWGTGLYESRAQSDLKAQFREVRTRYERTTTTAETPTRPGTTTSSTGPPTQPPSTTTRPAAPPTPPAEGSPIAIVQIPRIGVDRAVVQGVGLADLRKGPGHFPNTPLPGQRGNAAIAGHRTTYGGPFNRLDELETGDKIDVKTPFGDYHYTVTEKFVVMPNETWVAGPPDRFLVRPAPADTALLTLTTCNPKFSARERLIVRASLDAERSPEPLTAPSQPVSAGGRIDLADGGKAQLSGTKSSNGPTVLWGLIVALVGGLWWLAFHRYTRWTTWIGGALPFLGVLFVFFTYLERVLPGSF